MFAYKCDRCGYTNKLKTNFKRHLSRKIPCKPLINDLNINIIYNKYFKNDNNNILQNVAKCSQNVAKCSQNVAKCSQNVAKCSQNVAVDIKCKYCNKQFKHTSSRYKHESTRCKIKEIHDVNAKKILEEKKQLEIKLKKILEDREKDKEIIEQLSNSGQYHKNKK